MNSNRIALLLSAVLFLAGCGKIHNTISQGEDDALMLRGNDPVAYFTEGAAIPGMPDIKADYNGVTYRFASIDNLELFKSDPARYEPRYAGFCSSGMPYALKADIGAQVFTIIDDKLYLFGSETSRRHWMMDADRNIELGDQYWESEVKDAYHRVQNYKRYLFKVDHYKDDDELAAEYQRRLKAGTLPPGI